MTAFESMSYKTHVPLAPLAPHPLPAGAADTRSVSDMTEAQVLPDVQEAVGEDEEEKGEKAAAAVGEWGRGGMGKTKTVPGSVAAMLEQGFLEVNVGGVDASSAVLGEGDDAHYLGHRDGGGYEILSTHFDSASPTVSSDEGGEDKKSGRKGDIGRAVGKEEDAGHEGGEAVPQDEGNDLVDTLLRQHRAAMLADAAAPSRADDALGRHGPPPMPQGQEMHSPAAEIVSLSPGAAVSGEGVKIEGSVESAKLRKAREEGAVGGEKERGEAEEDAEEDVPYEIRVVYVTDSTIGLRTTWPDGCDALQLCLCVCVCACARVKTALVHRSHRTHSIENAFCRGLAVSLSTARDCEGLCCRFEVVEEIFLATGELVADEAERPLPPEAKTETDTLSSRTGTPVPRSEAILRHDSPDALRQRSPDTKPESVDKRVHAPRAQDLGIEKGMLVRVIAKVRYIFVYTGMYM